MPPDPRKSTNQAHLENGTYEQSVTHLERELELNSLKYPVETQMNTVTQKQQFEGKQDNSGNFNSDTYNTHPNKYQIDRETSALYPLSETRGKTNHSTETCYIWANAANRPLPWRSKPQQQDAQDSITGSVRDTVQHLNWKCHISGLEQWLTDRRPAEENPATSKCYLAATSADICKELKLANIQIDLLPKLIKTRIRPN